MIKTTKIPRLLAMLAACLLGSPLAQAEQSQDFGPYVVHYSAITTDTLLPEVARQYNIPRSRNRAVLTLSVLKKVMDMPGAPVQARVTGNATNLNAQMRTLEFREIKDESAVYYLSELPVSHRETLDFNVQVVPAGTSNPLTVKFRQEFFTE